MLNNPDQLSKLVSIGIGYFVLVIVVILYAWFRAHSNSPAKRNSTASLEEVKKSSTRCQDLIDINMKYSFHELETQYSLSKTVNSKVQFDHFDSYSFLVEDLSTNIEWAEAILNMADENKTQFEKYMAEVAQIENTPDAVIKGTHIKPLNYIDIEDYYFNTLLLSPTTKVSVEVVVRYLSPKGQRFYENKDVYDEVDIKQAISKAKKGKQIQNDKRDQRALMTPSLRYKILQRDGFRCCLCGASKADGAVLEVDHIIPVSRGGLTKESNLRTLCRDCNRGKSAKYNPYGLN